MTALLGHDTNRPCKLTYSIAPLVMVGEGRPSTSFLAAISKDVDGEPSPTMRGEAKPDNFNHSGRWYNTANGADFEVTDRRVMTA